MIWIAFSLGIVVGLAIFAGAVTIGAALHEAGQAHRHPPTPSRATNPAVDEWVRENVRHKTGPFESQPVQPFQFREHARRFRAQKPPR